MRTKYLLKFNIWTHYKSHVGNNYTVKTITIYSIIFMVKS